MTNHFETAINSNQLTDFLLGRSQYFYLDRDRGVHDPTTSGMIVADYGKIHGCHEMAKNLNDAFSKSLKLQSLTLYDVQTMFSFIFFWKTYKEHQGDAMCPWEPTAEVANELFAAYERLSSSGDNKIVVSLIDRLRTRFNWPSQT